MSYFADELAAGVRLEDHDRIVPVADGVVIERRSVLWLSVGAVASLLFGAPRLRAQEPSPRPTGGVASPGFEQFLRELLPQARRLVASGGEDEEAYLFTVAAALTRLREPQAPIRDAMQAFVREHRQDGERFPLSAVAMRLEPGKGFEHHDHLDYNGVILGLDGEVRIRNYDPFGELPPIDSKQSFALRLTRGDLILPGRISTLGRTRENIHDLVAGKAGARVLDVFTFFTGEATSRYLDVAAKARDAEAGVFEAAWRPRTRR